MAVAKSRDGISVNSYRYQDTWPTDPSLVMTTFTFHIFALMTLALCPQSLILLMPPSGAMVIFTWVITPILFTSFPL